MDDLVTIGDNPSIQKLWPLGPVLSPSPNILSAGRPLLNLSFALNYACGGVSVRGYHVVNLAIHLLAALTLWGIVRRTFCLPTLREKFGADSLWLAWAVALLWALHPVQTNSVTYISQRAESLMGLCYLATLYCFVRGATSPSSALWYSLSVTACGLGVATKEVMVTAPLLILLYDRTFVADTFRAALKQRWQLYAGLAASWLILASLMASSELGERAIGFTGQVTWWTYALTESRVVLRYLQLAFWPHPLVFDYGYEMFVTRVGQVWPYLLGLTGLLVLTSIVLYRWPRAGFLAISYFLLLAPTSSVVPLTAQPIAESRMYLPLVPVIALVVMGAHALGGRKSLVLLLALVVTCGWLTVQRNQDYQNEIILWQDVVAKMPRNSRAHCNLGGMLIQANRNAEAALHLQEAKRLEPKLNMTSYHLGILAASEGRWKEAVAHYQDELRLDGRSYKAYNNLGLALVQLDRPADAILHFEAALRWGSKTGLAYSNLGYALLFAGRTDEAISCYEKALRLDPDLPMAHTLLGHALAERGRITEAIEHCQIAVRLSPHDPAMHANLAHVLLKAGRRSDAIAKFQKALRIDPNYAPAREYLQQLGPR